MTIVPCVQNSELVADFYITYVYMYVLYVYVTH